jgi:hypothetical protein
MHPERSGERVCVTDRASRLPKPRICDLLGRLSPFLSSAVIGEAACFGVVGRQQRTVVELTPPILATRNGVDEQATTVEARVDTEWRAAMIAGEAIRR